MDWLKFFEYYEIGDEYVIQAMPEIIVFWDFQFIEEL
jgi:hypothetical protein